MMPYLGHNDLKGTSQIITPKLRMTQWINIYIVYVSSGLVDLIICIHVCSHCDDTELNTFLNYKPYVVFQ